MKVLEIIRFYSLEKIMEYMNQGNDYPKHHIWCYDKILESGNQVGEVIYNKNSFVQKIGKILRIYNLEQQIRSIKKSKDYDIIFVPFIDDIFLIALLKVLKLYTKPILAISDHVIHVNTKNRIKSHVTRIIRYIYLNGVDEILFLNENIYNGNLKYGKIPPQHGFIRHWGTDLDFFQNFVLKQEVGPTKDFIFSTGGTNRDYETIIKAFRDLKSPLKIALKRKNFDLMKFNQSNILVDDSVHLGYSSTAKLRENYYNSFAVAVPIKYKYEKCAGLTVIFEAMAMGKPIITTKNEYYSFDVEEEGIGINVDFGDSEGWIAAVNYLTNNPDKAKVMGERALELCMQKYNYDLFSTEILEHINNLSVTKKIN